MEKIVFLHPDLGIGGAERAIVDAAIAAKSIGFNVEIVTNYHDAAHCFEETIDGTIKVTKVCSWLPRSTFGRLIALWAFFKMFIAAFWLCLFRKNESTLVFVDQVSAPLPILRLFGFKTLFYCHFPDMLLASHDSFISRVYRSPIDFFEEQTTAFADIIVVNSQFTAEIFRKTFISLKNRHLELLYPIPNFSNLHLPADVYPITERESFSLPDSSMAKMKLNTLLQSISKVVFLSINRYERKKNINLALESFAKLLQNWSDLIGGEDLPTALTKSDVQIIHVGGYDSRVRENVEHFRELSSLADDLKINNQVVLLRSCTSDVKALLIAASSAVLYTPDNEHFGIVPIEAMFLGRPVIALNSGGPRETIVHNQTGFLCETASSIDNMVEYMSRFIRDPELSTKMGRQCHQHVMDNFSNTSFQHHLSEIVSSLVKGDDKSK